jgi:LmbE family N-acetylglucosaminyl deacetylase
MAVHAHPDDEASSTGGVLARYSAEGIRTILVTCTNGELGDAPGGVKPGEPGHDEATVVLIRRRELEESCRLLGVTVLERLGYRDSGMMGWPSNEAEGAFWTIPVEVAATPLVGLMELYRPDVVLTYDDFGFYGHPDHIQAHRITIAALERSGLPAKVYFPTIRRSGFAAFAEWMIEAGVEPPEVDLTKMGSPDEDIDATIDCREQAPAKFAALQAHASQIDNMFFLQLGLTDFTRFFGIEEFVCFSDPFGGSTPTDDLFSGLRPGAGR